MKKRDEVIVKYIFRDGKTLALLHSCAPQIDLLSNVTIKTRGIKVYSYEAIGSSTYTQISYTASNEVLNLVVSPAEISHIEILENPLVTLPIGLGEQYGNAT